MEIFGVNIVEALITGVFSAAFVVFAFFIRQALDWDIMPSLVRRLSIIPMRGAELRDYPQISGKWDHIYETLDYTGPHKKVINKERGLYIFSNRIYSVYIADGVKYFIFGRFDGLHVTGYWRAKSARRLDYAGSFQLKVVDEDNMSGRWIGFSKRSNEIHHGVWKWSRS